MTAPVHTEPTFTPDSVLEDVIAGAFQQSMAEQGTPAGDLQRDPVTGKFLPREGSEPTTDGDTANIAATPEGERPAATNGEVVTLPQADTASLMTEFTLKDDKGELAIPAGLIIEYTASGKVRADALDKVVKMAQWGHHNLEREQRVRQVEAQSEEVRSYATSVEQKLATREAQLERLLSDPDYRENAIQHFAAQQTPEKRAERAQQEVEQLKLSHEQQAIAAQGKQFFAADVLPSYEMTVKAFPNVTDIEIGQKLMGFVNRLKDSRTDLVPPSAYPKISQFFLTDLIPWARSLDDVRAVERGTKSGREMAQSSAQAQTKTDADLDAERLKNQRLRRTATTNLRPPGRGATSAPAPKKAPVTREEIMEDVIASTKAATYGMA